MSVACVHLVLFSIHAAAEWGPRIFYQESLLVMDGFAMATHALARGRGTQSDLRLRLNHSKSSSFGIFFYPSSFQRGFVCPEEAEVPYVLSRRGFLPYMQSAKFASFAIFACVCPTFYSQNILSKRQGGSSSLTALTGSFKIT